MDGAENFSLKIEKNGGKILPNALKFLYEKELPRHQFLHDLVSTLLWSFETRCLGSGNRNRIARNEKHPLREISLSETSFGAYSCFCAQRVVWKSKE